jgi:hypothetical protein
MWRSKFKCPLCPTGCLFSPLYLCIRHLCISTADLARNIVSNFEHLRALPFQFVPENALFATAGILQILEPDSARVA